MGGCVFRWLFGSSKKRSQRMIMPIVFNKNKKFHMQHKKELSDYTRYILPTSPTARVSIIIQNNSLLSLVATVSFPSFSTNKNPNLSAMIQESNYSKFSSVRDTNYFTGLNKTIKSYKNSSLISVITNGY